MVTIIFMSTKIIWRSIGANNIVVSETNETINQKTKKKRNIKTNGN